MARIRRPARAGHHRLVAVLFRLERGAMDAMQVEDLGLTLVEWRGQQIAGRADAIDP